MRMFAGLVALPVDLDRIGVYAAGSVEHLHTCVTQQRHRATLQHATTSILRVTNAGRSKLGRSS